MRARYIPAGRTGGTECAAKTCFCVKIVSKLRLYKPTASVNIYINLLRQLIFYSNAVLFLVSNKKNLLFPLYQKIIF